jgi:hypothetical protein
MTWEEHIEAVNGLASKIGNPLQADVIFISAAIERPLDRQVIEACIKRKRQKNVILILVTTGGNADVAYRIARCLQDKYEAFTCFIPGICKSAGTIMALGANDLIISDQGEMGPLDVQLYKSDELWELSSGLTAMDALNTMQFQAFNMFETYLLELKRKSQGQITLKTAAEIASNMTAGLYGKIYAQIDPMKLGENSRAMTIAQQYGERLGQKGDNLNDNTVTRLAARYPSHGFVIDRKEAATLFKRVRVPDESECELIQMLGEIALTESSSPIFDFLGKATNSDAIIPTGDGNGQLSHQRRDDRASSERAAGGLGSPVGATEKSTTGNRTKSEAKTPK